MNELIDYSGDLILRRLCFRLASEHLIELTPVELWRVVRQDADGDWVVARQMLQTLAEDRYSFMAFALSIDCEPTEEMPPVIVIDEPASDEWGDCWRVGAAFVFSWSLVMFALGGYAVAFVFTIWRP